jgi:hypothetical protein
MRKMEGNFYSKCFTSSGRESGIGCSAGKEETEGSAIGKMGGKNDLAAGTGQENSTWLVSGATVILNFLKKSMPSMGPATAACKHLAVNSLP